MKIRNELGTSGRLYPDLEVHGSQGRHGALHRGHCTQEGQGPSVVDVHGTDMELSKDGDPVMALLHAKSSCHI